LTDADGGRGAPIVVLIDPEIFDMVPGFLENRRADVASLVSALDAGDMEGALRLGHMMKGVGGGYGFEEITRLGSAIEIAATAADSGTVRERLAELADYLHRVEVRPDPDG